MSIESENRKKLVKEWNDWVVSNWFTVLAIAMVLILIIYTPNMINSAVTDCNNYWLNKTIENSNELIYNISNLTYLY
jgi:hypothetical protein